jgi:hypothetical protein
MCSSRSTTVIVFAVLFGLSMNREVPGPVFVDATVVRLCSSRP